MKNALFAALAVCVASPVFAQSIAPNVLRPITPHVKDGGTLHVATGTWTRGPLPAGLGPDVIYNNTCPSGFFPDINSDTYTDEGRVPSPTSPGPTPLVSSQPGCATSYVVNGFQIAYCTNHATSAEVRIDFYSAYVPCSAVPGAPTASFDLTGLPHSLTGLSACWTLNVDLTAAGSPGSTFTLAADADGSFDGGTGVDTFGWSFRMPNIPPFANAGPLIAGNPAQCLGFGGTSWDPTPNPAQAGTGMGTLDFFRLDSSIVPSGCYFFGGAGPFASFHLKLYGDTCANSGPNQVAYCFGDNTCPCSNPGAPGHGCANSVNSAGALLGGTGFASLSADSLVLSGSGMPSTASVLYFQGNAQQNAGLGTPFGDGLRCTTGGLVRLGAKSNVGGASSYPNVGDVAISTRGLVTNPGPRCYQAWYRNNAAFCTPAPFNLTNGWLVNWAP